MDIRTRRDTTFYVYGRREAAGQEWLEIGPDSHGKVAGFAPTRQLIPWNQALTVTFKDPASGERVLLFRDRDSLKRLIDQNDLESYERYYDEAIRGDPSADLADRRHPTRHPHRPLREGLPRRPAGLHEVVLSRSAAERLKIAKGALIQASLSRQYHARHERVRLDLRIVDVASERAFARPAVFASLEVLMAAEAFRDGRAVPTLGWSGDPPLAEERVFPSFRLYARTIYEVAGLASVLTEGGSASRPRPPRSRP